MHTNHPAFGYEIRADRLKVVWAPEFFEFPTWAKESDVLFAEASSWNRPILFRGGVGGHLDALSVQRASQKAGVKRLVLAHIGRPTIRAIEGGATAIFGELARDGEVFCPRVRTGFAKGS